MTKLTSEESLSVSESLFLLLFTVFPLLVLLKGWFFLLLVPLEDAFLLLVEEVEAELEFLELSLSSGTLVNNS